MLLISSWGEEVLIILEQEFCKCYNFSGLTVELAHLASEGDRLSQQLFIDAGAALADHMVALLRHSRVDRMRVVCVGSVWKSWSLLQPGVLKRFAEKKVSRYS